VPRDDIELAASAARTDQAAYDEPAVIPPAPVRQEQVPPAQARFGPRDPRLVAGVTEITARLTATMSVTPRPCVSLRRHGQIDVTLARLLQLGTIDGTIAAFLAAAVKSRCNIIVTGGVSVGKATAMPVLTTLLRAV